MMTLIAIAITRAYVYSSAVVFGLSGKVFFWEKVAMNRSEFLNTAFGVFAALSGLLYLSGAAPADQIEFRAVLRAYQHGMPVAAPARGEAVFWLSKDGSELHYRLTVTDIEDVIMSHLHLDEEHEISTPIVWLYPSSPPPKLIPGRHEGVLAEGTITAEDLRGPLEGKPLVELIREMRAGHAYVNLHTRHHHHFELRGQVGSYLMAGLLALSRWRSSMGQCYFKTGYSVQV